MLNAYLDIALAFTLFCIVILVACGISYIFDRRRDTRDIGRLFLGAFILAPLWPVIILGFVCWGFYGIFLMIKD